MKPYNSRITFLKSGIPSEFYRLRDVHPLQTFSEDVISYLNILSKEINKDPLTRNYPDVATFAFFCRKANINQLKKKHYNENQLRLGRGLAFHVAPSNVPVNFAYSLVSGLLSGNANIVKVPSKPFEQIDIIGRAMSRIAGSKQISLISDRVFLVKYDRKDEKVTEELSSICDVRIIWGGDDTINNIRKHSIPPRSFDITFADRYSISVINADEYVNEQKQEKLGIGFYNDTYLFDQNACTSPYLLIWLGSPESVDNAKQKFWRNIHSLVKNQYEISSVSAIEKLTIMYDHAISSANIKNISTDDNLLVRVEAEVLDIGVEKFQGSCGYFIEYHAESLNSIKKIISEKYQTLSYYGVPQKLLLEFMEHDSPKGIDRIVPIGRTMEFDLDWDGYNITNSLSRAVCLL